MSYWFRPPHTLVYQQESSLRTDRWGQKAVAERDNAPGFHCLSRRRHLDVQSGQSQRS
jgi:hypothetical protein